VTNEVNNPAPTLRRPMVHRCDDLAFMALDDEDEDDAVSDCEHNDIIYPAAIPFVLVHLACLASIWTGIASGEMQKLPTGKLHETLT
jgi:hypothetical protein